MFLSLSEFFPTAARIRSPPPAILTLPHEGIFFGSSLQILFGFGPFMIAEKYRDILDCNAVSSAYDSLYGGRKIESGSENFVRRIEYGKNKTDNHQTLFHPSGDPLAWM